MKKIVPAVLFILFISFFSSCEKRLNKTIRVKGRVIDWYNQQPGNGVVTVQAQDASSHKLEKVNITSIDLDADGSFDKTFKAARSGDYYITYGDPDHGAVYYHLTIKDNATQDFGKIEISHTFVCKVTLDYTSGRDVTIIFGSDHAFHANTHTTYYDAKGMSEKEFKNRSTYDLFYQVIGPSISEFSTVAVPIGQSDTVSTAVHF